MNYPFSRGGRRSPGRNNQYHMSVPMNWQLVRTKRAKKPLFEDYINVTEQRPVKIDCSLGVNPMGSLFTDSVTNNANGIDELSIAIKNSFLYPDKPEKVLSELIVSRWKGVGVMVSPEQIRWGVGGDGVLVNLGLMFPEGAANVVGIYPQYLSGLKYFGVTSKSLKSLRTLPPKFKIDVNDMMSLIDDNTTLVFFDNPNNPTGGFMPLSDVALLADRCADCGALLLVDEAYGDFVPDEESAINLPHRNVICARNLSKGYGMAGLRLGYIVIRDEELMQSYENVELLFAVADIPTAIAAKFLPTIDLHQMRADVRKLKASVLDVISNLKGLCVSETHENVPIFTLTWDSGENLYDKLMDEGIKSVNGRFFLMGENSVRLRIPSEHQLQLFNESMLRLFR